MYRTLHQASALLLALILAATLLAGCAAPWPFPQPTPDPVLPDSQQIVRPLEVGPASGDLETLDPALIEFPLDQNLAQLVFPPLVTLDEQGAPIDWAAVSHQVSADGLTYTFHLRNGMVWSDGTPIDATTFAYAINRSEDPCTSSPVSYYLDPIKGATALYHETCPTGATHVADTLIGTSVIASDPQTLTILLTRPTGYFLMALTSSTAWAVPQQLIDQYADKWTDHLRDNGGFGGNLYRLTKWDHAGHIEFERNERFWGQKPQLRRIEENLYKSADKAWTDFKAGTGDVSALSDSTPRVAATDMQEAQALKGVALQRTLLLGESFLTPNWKRAPFDDLRVRQAFSLALDRQAIAHDGLLDTVQPSMHLVPEGLPTYNPGLADPVGRMGSTALTADLDTARRLASAYAAEKCGGDFAKCPQIEFATSSFASQMEVQQWSQAFPGWPIVNVGRGAQVKNPQIPILLGGGWSADYPDPQDFLSILWTTHAPHNNGSASIPQVDTLCAQADSTLDQAARIPLYQQAEQLLVTQVAAIPLYQFTDVHAVRSRVVGWRVAPTGMTPLSVWQATYIRR